MQKTYDLTDEAGREVAGFKIAEGQKTIKLTDKQAAHPLRLGHIRHPLDHDGDGKLGGAKPAKKPDGRD